MFNVSKEFNQEINKLQGRKFNAKVIIRDKEFSGSLIYEMSLEESVNPSDSFSIGTVCSNSFEIKLINTGDVFENAVVKPYVGLYIGEKVEYVPLGVFNVVKSNINGKFINLECVDNMLKLEGGYFSDLSYPADINDIAKEICKKVGINLASKLPNYRVNKIEGYSLREAIGFIASLCGSFARFNRIGDLEIKGYEIVKQEMTPNNLFKLDIDADECIIRKIIAQKGEEELSVGIDEGNKIIFNNPVITKEILNDIYSKYDGFKYISYTAKWKGNPAIMAGDILGLTDTKGNKYNALIMEQKFVYKNGISSEVKAKGKSKQESNFDSKGSITKTMERYSIEQASIKKALIDKANINDLTAINAKIERLYTEDLTAIRADIVTLNSKKANITELNSVRADLQQAIIGKANITDLNAAVGKINVLESKTASIENALLGNLTADNFKANSITATSGIIAEGAIGSAQISSLSVNKLEAGEFITSKHKIVSADGTIEIVGNQILINRNNVNRVILGEYRKSDGTTEYGLLVRAKDGQTIMLDGNGVHKAGITNGAIDNNKVADNANISGNKLDINSVIREVNSKGTETIKGTRVQVGDRTLDIELSTQKNIITEHSKELSSQKATIQALDNAIKLKVDSQTFTQSTTTINNNINKAKEEAINSANSNTTNAINNIKVGGENLVSNLSENWEIGSINQSVLAESSYTQLKYPMNNRIRVKELIEVNDIFCVSYNNDIFSCCIALFDSNKKYLGRVAGFIDWLNDGVYKHNSKIKYIAVVAKFKNEKNITLNDLEELKLKIEVGNKATGFSLSLEDLKKYSDDVAKAKSDLAKTEAIANADGKITEEERKRIQQAQENLNLAIAKAEKAKQDAINTASTDATNKANNALNSAKAYTNTEITTVNTHLNKATAEINVLKKQIELKVGQSDIDKSIQNIEFGGRNLFLKSKGPFKSSNEYVGISITSVVEKYLNKKITISADVKANKVGKIRFYSLGGYSVGFWVERDVTTEWTRIKATGKFTLNDEKQKWCDLSFYGNYGSGLFTEVRNVKIELGELASDYTEAPEDTDKLIIDNIKTVTDKISTVESKFTQENNSIKASVQDLNSTTQSITTNVSNINRDLTNKINFNLDVAKNFATSKAIEALNSAKSYTNAEITTVNSKVHNLESGIDILKDKINSKVSQSDIDKSIQEINFNSRNYIKNSLDKFLTGSDNPNNTKRENGKFTLLVDNLRSNAYCWWKGYENINADSDICCSVDIKINDNTQGTLSLDCGNNSFHNGNEKGYDLKVFKKGEWKRISATGKATSNFSGLLCITIQGAKKGLVVEYRNFKVSTGLNMPDWTPAPEDTNQLVVDSIKVVDTKISDVSSSITQLRDSVTTQINSINSKTHSIETTLGSKASKQEVTEVNNRVATIKASLDGITQRVSATESKTQTLESNLNGKASKQEVNNVSSKVVSLEANLNGITNRVSSTETVTKSLNDKLWETTNKLNNVEQRITPTSIINTVSSAYYKKGEVDNVFSTKSQVEQLDNRINYRFSNTGYSNLIFNGNFANGTVHWRNWGNCSLVAENGQLTVRAKQSSNNANIGAVSSTFVLEKGKKYSLTFQGCSSWNIPWLNYIYLLGEDGVNHRLDLRIDINSADLVYRTATFTAPATKWVRLLIGVEGYLQTDISGFKLVDVCLVEGDIPRRFVPNANEISEGATSIDSNGVIVRHTNGSYTSMTLGGFAWKTKNMEKAYHCLAETGWVNISTGAWLGDHYDIKITLPEYFRGKVFTPCSMIQGWYVESNFSLNQLVVNIPYETINYSEGSFVIRVKALTRDGTFQRNINISWLAIA